MLCSSSMATLWRSVRKVEEERGGIASGFYLTVRQDDSFFCNYSEISHEMQ